MNLHLQSEQAVVKPAQQTASILPDPQQTATVSPEPKLTIPVNDFLSDTNARAVGMDDHLILDGPDPAGEMGQQGGGTAPPPPEDPTPAFSGLTEPEGMGSGAPSGMSETDAIKQTRTIIGMRETGQAMLISWIADGSLESYQTYYYETWQKELLIEAYAPLIQAAGITVNPWIKVAYAEAVSTGPLIALTIKNRKQRLENEELRAQIIRMQKEAAAKETAEVIPDPLQQQQQKVKIPVPGNVQTRRDIKTHWKVDKGGYFEHTPEGDYIPIPHRKTKPQLTPDNYEMLCKHNGKDKIDQIYNIRA